MARRHWIWDAYRALTQERRMTESEAIGELTALWPSLPVFDIVRAEGNYQGSSQGQRSGLPSGVGMLTQADIMNAGTGRTAQGQAEYDPAADIIRSRFSERYGQG